MQRHGFLVEALSSPGPLLERFGAREGVRVHAVEMARRITPLQDLVAIARLWRRLRAIRPHIVHAHTPKAGLLGMIAAWLARVPVRIYHIHGLPLMTASGHKRWLLRWSEKISCWLAQQVLCVSHSIRDVAIAETLCPAAKIKVLLGGSINGVDAQGRFSPASMDAPARRAARESLGIPHDALVIGFIGRVVRDKGVEELVAAWRLIRDQFPTLHLIVAGPFEPYDPVSPEAEATLRRDPRIHLTGWVDDTLSIHASIDILALPTYREGFPVVPLEAAAMAVPVVATRIPGCIDAVQDGVTGTLVPVGDVAALAEAIRSYILDPDLRRQHGRAGRERVLREFQQEAIWEATLQEYLRLLRRRGLPLPEPVAGTSSARSRVETTYESLETLD
ncbi:glycosyltransferase family 4 protein [Kallotenue papyrolyticum]|uniref:glycosyltransferase family 4 protein n=1 Tax=Kallotenue papyrolyticum TaxID=1325125 RepID=UPI0023ED9AD3|nr:glycosyltransferase family 4 protein [Kallotenue papyrolyticum]